MIPFTQYIPPYGRQLEIGVERPAEVEAQARRILARGWRFEAEILAQVALVSLTITGASDALSDGEEVDLAVLLGPNDETIGAQVDALVAKGIQLLEEEAAPHPEGPVPD